MTAITLTIGAESPIRGNDEQGNTWSVVSPTGGRTSFVCDECAGAIGSGYYSPATGRVLCGRHVTLIVSREAAQS